MDYGLCTALGRILIPARGGGVSCHRHRITASRGAAAPHSSVLDEH